MVTQRNDRAARKKSARLRMTSGRTGTADGVAATALAIDAPGGVIAIAFRPILRGQRLPTLATTGVQDLAASFGRHACAKAVAPLADQIGWLKCAFHRVSPSGSTQTILRFKGLSSRSKPGQ